MSTKAPNTIKISMLPSLSPLLLLSPGKEAGAFLGPLNGSRISFYFNARNAIWNAIKILRIPSYCNVLLPSYNCGAEVDTFVKSGMEVKFYRVDSSMKIDFDHLQKMIDKNTRAIVVIHYFGFPQDLNALLSLCRAHHLFLLEDCAHALYSQYQNKFLGTFGDVGVFSMWKSLPIPNGGALVINNPALAVPGNSMAPPHFFETAVRIKQLIERGLVTQHGALGRAIKKVGIDPLTGLIKLVKQRGQSSEPPQNSTLAAIDFQPDRGNWKMSGISERIIRKIDREAVVKKRRENFQFVASELSGRQEMRLLFTDLPQGVCPTFFPIIVDDPEALFEYLMGSGVESITFWLDFHKTLPKDDFPDAAFLKTHVLALPIHQDLSFRELKLMTERLVRYR